jgi:membrane-associated phospholipid phosphatase
LQLPIGTTSVFPSYPFGPIACALVVVMFGLSTLCGCTTLANGRGWGEDATITPGWSRVGEAALSAAKSPRFWGPVAAAAVFQIDGWDRKVSDWARRNTPVFGSEQNAADWSNRLRTASAYAYFASVLVTPSGSDPSEWALDKLRGTAVGLAAIVTTDEESALIKNASGRERPNGQDDQSMPSSHTSRAAVLTQLAERNVETLPIGPIARGVLDAGLDALAYGTAWARVESGFHFPSDTLVGMSIGNFNGAFFTDAFLGLPNQSTSFAFSVVPVPGGAMLRLRYGF